MNEQDTCNEDCSSNANCLKDTYGEPYCSCPEGYEGDGKYCVDVNECLTLNSGCEQQCHNINKSYYCTCNIGFYLHTNQRSCLVVKRPAENDQRLYCTANFNQSVEWPTTLSGKTILMQCPNNPAIGQASRTCNGSSWLHPDLRQCISPELHNISKKVSIINVTNIEWDNVKSTLRLLSRDTYPPMNVLYAGDILETKIILTRVLAFLVETIKGQPLNEWSQFLELFNNVLNNIFDPSNHVAWHGFPEVENEINEYLSLVTSMATILSNHMTGEMNKYSMKNPKLQQKFNISSVGNEIAMEIQLMEMRRFNKSLYSVPSRNMTFNLNFPNNFFYQDVEKLMKEKGSYTLKGCWADYDRKASRYSLEAKHYLLQDNFLTRDRAIEKCAIVADSLGYNMFVLQDGGICAAGPDMHETFDGDGPANNCMYGKGGIFASNVYEINKFYVASLSISYKTLARLLLSISTKSKLPPSSTTIAAYGEIITTKLIKDNMQEDLVMPYEITFEKNIGNRTDVYCAQMLAEQRTISWTMDNCVTIRKNNRVICNCSKFGHELLLYNVTIPQHVPIVTDDTMKIFSYTSFAVAAACYIVPFIVHAFCRYDKTAVIFQYNIAFVTIFSQGIFIFGIASDMNIHENVCKALVILFQFLLTSIFSWFLAQTSYAYYELSDFIKQTVKRRTAIYFLIGYGIPCVVSLLSMAIFYDDYGMKEKCCWMETTLLISLFLPPIAALIIINIVVLGMVVGIYFSPRTNIEFSENNNIEKENEGVCSSRDVIRLSSLMIPLVSATWVFGIFSIMLDDGQFSKIMFHAINIAQGVVYLVSSCFFRRKVERFTFCQSSNDDEYDFDSPVLANVNLKELRANTNGIVHIRNGFVNDSYSASPSLSKAKAFDGNNFIKVQNSTIPVEVLFEMQQQWQKKEEKEINDNEENENCEEKDAEIVEL